MLRQQLQRFMFGRYGMDPLSMALLGLSVAISFLAMLPKAGWVGILSYLPLILCLYRALSRDIPRRQLENQQFLAWFGGVRSWFGQKSQRVRDSRAHCFFHCPSCSTTVRVPRGKGKIEITCPSCHHQFVKKT